MSTQPQRRATAAHRRKAAARGIVRVEVQAPKADAPLIKALAQTLRDDHARADAVRAAVERALGHAQPQTAFDIFGSGLPDEAFAGVFDHVRPTGWREVEL